MVILVASNNPKKLGELERILADAGIEGVELRPLSAVEPYPEPVEDGRTFADNALIKARAGAAAMLSELPARYPVTMLGAGTTTTTELDTSAWDAQADRLGL